MSDIVLTRAELAADLASERQRATRLEQQLRQARAENAALKTARDIAVRMCVWGSSRQRVDGTTRHEH